MNIVFLFYEGMTALDVVGPHEILSRLPGANTQRVALRAGAIKTDSGLILKADYEIKNISEADILCIPGAGNATSLSNHPDILSWINKIHHTTKWTTSVCTGSLILGAAGLLSGTKATTHWAALDRLHQWGALPQDSRIVEDGKIITAAGVSAGIDMALMLAAKICGDKVAQSLQLGIEYDPEPPFDAGSPKKVEKTLVDELRKRITSLFENL